jgi:MFS family permease
MQASATATQDALGRVYHRLCWRLMPLFCVCIVLNYLDRTSLSFASIQMTAQLGLSPETLGLGGGIFFVTYCLMQVGHVEAPCSRCFAAACVGLCCIVLMLQSTPPEENAMHMATHRHTTSMCWLANTQVPSNIICVRVGVRRWLSAIMLCWGAVAALLAAVRARWQFFLLRALLGLAESGSFPAV